MAKRIIRVEDEIIEVKEHMDNDEIAIKKSSNTISLINYFLGGQLVYIFPAMIAFISLYPNEPVLESTFAEAFLSTLAPAIALVFAFFINSKLLKKELNIFKNNLIPSLISVFVNLALVYIFLIGYGYITELIFGEYGASNQNLIEEMLANHKVLIGISVVIIAPILEEIVFRGNMFKRMRKSQGFVKSALFSSLIFGAMHILVGLISGDMMELVNLPIYAGIGYFLALAYEQTGSIYTPIILHMVYNGISFILMLVV